MAWTGTIDEYFINHWPQGKTVTIVGAKGFTGNVEKSSTTVSARKDLIENGQVVGQSVALIFGHATQSEYTLDKIVLQAQVQDEQNPRAFATYLNNPGVVIETAPEFAFQIWCSFRLNSANTVNVTVDPAAYVTTQILEEALSDLSDTYMVKGVDYVTAGQKSGTTLGNKSTIEGDFNSATGNCSHVEGYGNLASSNYSHVEGYINVSSGLYSHTEGSECEASATGAHAEGGFCLARGNYSHAEGYYANSKGNYSHAENGVAEGVASHAETSGNAIGNYSHAEGTGYSYGVNSHAECGGSAFGKNSHAESSNPMDSTRVVSGSGTSYTSTTNLPASAKYKIIKVEDTNKSAYITSIDSSNSKLFTTNVSLGTLDSADVLIITGALGESSHTEGYKTSALKNYSHSEGNGTVSAGESQHVSGKFNVIDIDNTYAEIIGNGTSENIRKNARTLDWSGNEWLAGTIKVGGTSYTDANAKEVATKEYVDNAISGVSGLFIAEFGVTTYNDITNALNANKLVLLKNNSSSIERYILLSYLDDRTSEKKYSFVQVDNYGEYAVLREARVNNSDVWGWSSYEVQQRYLSSVVTLTASGWNNNTQTVSVSWVSSSNLVQVSPDPTSLKEYGSCGVYCSAQGIDSLTFTCDTVPTNNLTVNAVVWR